MENRYNSNNLFIILPSKVEEQKIVQNPNDITIVTKDKQNNYIDIFTNEEIYVFQREALQPEKKYIRVFRDDFTQLSNFVFSLKTDFIEDTKLYMELIMSIKSEYTKEELEKIMFIIKKEIYNFKCTQTRKMPKSKMKILKK